MNISEYIVIFQLIIIISISYLMYRYFTDMFTQYYFMTTKRLDAVSMVYNSMEDRYFKVCPKCKQEKDKKDKNE